MCPSILIADDELNTREGLRKALASDYRKVDTAADGSEALAKLKRQDYDVLITDIRMPGLDGMQLLQKTRELSPPPGVILLTAYGTIEMAVEAMKLGAYNYLTKPVNLDELELLVNQILEKRQIEQEIEFHRERDRAVEGFEGIVGESPPIQQLIGQIKQIAPTKATVLITGETGTGKELVARAIHNLSPRRHRLFVPIHCAALSENLLESELFGHERGAFTGAIKQKKGRFEQAHQGTIFLDEVSEISAGIQVKLLRVLQEKAFERVGGTETISVDIRILAATNVDLQKLVDEDKFREDLYYRLKVVTLDIPPLRERAGDIPLLTTTFIQRYALENGKGPMQITPEALNCLQKYQWPGNVRELQGVLESMVILARGNRLDLENIPLEIRRQVQPGLPLPAPPLPPGNATLADIEKKVILETLEKFQGNRTKTAEALGIGRRTLIRKLHEYGVTKSSEDNES
ncbi:MAG TPA: sigma-54 dependent transcriptional regulator [bacterium]|nr:sigma-54-dependent Fis family transcriptional regulator [Candidatus Omnitrophota bacterium]HOJ62104.1 sigma-54 dependent transcriptional regulator [bacterium]HOL93773.1 sigma-54 dependent transcriptional regulator [bacterium]HPP01824.1 sigma-54 dependent transcriptional regulator [bacterium]